LAGELGFLLSVLATAGLVLLGPVVTERWSGTLGRTCATALAAPVAAQLVCAPAVLLAQPSVSLVAVPANLVVAPAVAPATVLGLAAALVDPWWPPVGAALAHAAGAACWWIGAVARIAAGLPGAQVPWLGGPVGVLLLAVASVAGARLVLARPD
jgi:competence protein ComEC